VIIININKILLIIGTLITGIVLNFLWPQGKSLPVLDTIPPFSMETITGEKYNSDNEKIKVVAFLYTHCPDICPMTMNDFKKLQRELKGKNIFGTDVQLVAISFDPERDTNSTLLKYASIFEADFFGWIWLRGSNAETKKVTSLFNLYYKKSSQGYYSHQTRIYLLDNNNELRAIYEMTTPTKPMDIEKILSDIDLLLSE
jgi:protein SCO1